MSTHTAGDGGGRSQQKNVKSKEKSYWILDTELERQLEAWRFALPTAPKAEDRIVGHAAWRSERRNAFYRPLVGLCCAAEVLFSLK